MKEQIELAARNLKTVGTEITQWENRLEHVKMEADKNARTRDALQAEIDKKTSDFSIYINQRDAETKNGYAVLLADREKLNGEKEEFRQILEAHRRDRDTLDAEKRVFDIEKLKFAATTQNVQEFITAIRRAVGVLGI